ncbi:MAG: hydroxyphenylacetyl-CoA thioesterase PaaI [Rhizobiaceae bacterium]|jgi:acyl-CoA thioesterase|nr:hydroxyphenylacetyl-CoA thioesterase PaaI [Rhizobiaceae bacterium]
MSSDQLSPDDMARACADSMWSTDNASKGLGMEILRISSGQADLKMTVRDDMTNGHKICHGGFIFTLADSAFAFACNGYNQYAVAQRCGIDFIAPAYAGDELTAKAKERNRSGRSGIYDVQVTNQDGAVIAELRGNSRTIKGQHLS